MGKTKLYIHTDLLLGFAAAILLLPLKWIIAWIIAASVHEAFHAMTLRLCNVRIKCLHLRLLGASMETEAMPGWKEGLCAIAGPFCIFLILPFSKILPRVFLCCLAQSVCNLIPLFPLDGGRFVRTIFAKWGAEEWFIKSQKILLWTLGGFIGFITIKYTLGPLFIAAVALLYVRNRKIFLQSSA